MKISEIINKVRKKQKESVRGVYFLDVQITYTPTIIAANIKENQSERGTKMHTCQTSFTF